MQRRGCLLVPSMGRGVCYQSVLTASTWSMLSLQHLCHVAMHREPKAWWGRVPTDMLDSVCNRGLLTSAAPTYEAHATAKEDGKLEHCATAKVVSLRCVQSAALQATLQHLSQLKLVWGLRKLCFEVLLEDCGSHLLAADFG